MEQKLSIPESRDATKQEKGDFYAERQNSSTCGVRKYCCVQDRIACQCTEKLHANVQVLMTKNAVNFINPITFESLTGNKCLVDTFDRNFQYSVEHVALAKQADVVLVAPASANVIGKIAHGIADDMLTTTVMACKCKKIIAPAMNTNMFDNPILQDNLKILEHYGYEVISPAVGYLACGDTGAGKMPEPELLLQYILREIAYEKICRVNGCW